MSKKGSFKPVNYEEESHSASEDEHSWETPKVKKVYKSKSYDFKNDSGNKVDSGTVEKQVEKSAATIAAEEFKYKSIEMFVNTVSVMMERYRNIDDPQLKYSLIVDKFMITLDIMLGALTSLYDNDTLPPSLREKITKFINETKGDLQNLQYYIAHPQAHLKTTVDI